MMSLETQLQRATQQLHEHAEKITRQKVEIAEMRRQRDLAAENATRLGERNAELEALFDLQHARTILADAEYVEAHPRADCPHGYKPDLGKLIDWLRNERDARVCVVTVAALVHALPGATRAALESIADERNRSSETRELAKRLASEWE